MWGEFNSARLIFVLFPFFCWASLYFIESCWAKRRTIETYPQYSASLPIISFSHPHLPSSTTPRHAQKAHMPTHMYTPTPQLQWLPVSTPASVVYMALPIEQMLWNLRCKTTPPSPPTQLTHACIYTHTQPSLSLPPAGPAMNMPCGAPFPLALWLWLCQLCRVWPPPTGKTKKTADSKCTLSLCAVWESVCVHLFLPAENLNCQFFGAIIFVKLKNWFLLSSDVTTALTSCTVWWEMELCACVIICEFACLLPPFLCTGVQHTQCAQHVTLSVRTCWLWIHLGMAVEFLLPWRCPSSPIIKFQLERD